MENPAKPDGCLYGWTTPEILGTTMNGNTTTNNEQQLNDKIMNHIMTRAEAEGLSIPSGMEVTMHDTVRDCIEAARGLKGDIEGADKKYCRTVISNALGIAKSTSYKKCIEAVMTDVIGAEASMTNIYNRLAVVDEEPEEDIVDVPTTSGTDVSDIEARISQMEATFGGAIDRLVGLVEAVASKQPVVAPQPEVEPSEPEASDEPKEYGLRVRKYKSKNPEGWKDGTHFSIGVVTDMVDKNGNGKPTVCQLIKATTQEEAIKMARDRIRRRLIQTQKGLNAKTQDSDTWVQIANEHGITDAVIDQFRTNPNKYVQQTRRTAKNLRDTLGITNVKTFNALANDIISGAEAPVASTPSTSGGLSLEDTTSSEVTMATVDPNEVREVMKEFGYSFAEAKAFLS
jgi:hypothetical protein